MAANELWPEDSEDEDEEEVEVEVEVEEEEEEENLPTLAFLMDHSPPSSPLPPPGERGGSSAPPARRAAAAAEEVVVVVHSSESEDEDEVQVIEINPLPQRIKRRVEAEKKAAFEPLQQGCGDAAGGGLLASDDDRLLETLVSSGDGSPVAPSAEKRSLCPVPLVDFQSQPRGSRPETSHPSKKRKYSYKDKLEICQAELKKRKDREARRQQEEEKKRKRALAKMQKAQRPGKCQEHITVVLDPVLFQVGDGKQVLCALQAGNYCSVVENQDVTCSITWRRKAVALETGEGDEWTEEPHILVLLPLEKFLSMVHNYKQEAQGCTTGQKETLDSYVTHLMEKTPGKIPSLAIVGVEKYFRSLQVGSRKRKAEDSGPDITRMHVQEALVDLQLNRQVHVTLFESWKSFGEFVAAFTKAVAEAPYKREQAKTEFPFYLEKEWRGGVKVDHSGKGLFQVWKRQIQQFNRISLETAEAIASAYPAPQLLIQAYKTCSSEQERENMLANIIVHRGDGVTATSRRVGPDISRRIYLQMTSHDPHLYLDFTG